jgi:hypothetical protein
MKWLFSLLLLSSLGSLGQKPAGSLQTSFSGGVEADVLPYVTGGYYMSVWGGYRHVRYRVILTDVNTPQFMLPAGFTNNQIEVYALITDWFFQRGFRGFWIGTGVEWWKGQIDTRDKSARGHYDTYMYTIGGGYVWNIYRNFYINPWAGGHLQIGGDGKVHVGTEVFSPPLLTPEMSLKLGWHF